MSDLPLIAVLDYGIGNLRSAQKALQHVGADARLTADPGLIADAAGVVLPGVGAFGRCADALRDAGLADPAVAAAGAAADGSGPPVPRHLHRHAVALRPVRGEPRRRPASGCSRRPSGGCPTA